MDVKDLPPWPERPLYQASQFSDEEIADIEGEYTARVNEVLRARLRLAVETLENQCRIHRDGGYWGEVRRLEPILAACKEPTDGR